MLKIHKEMKIHLKTIHEDLYGTLDIGVDDWPKKLRVYDYKHGSGQAVEVENNRQLIYYALGAIFHFHSDKLEIMDWGGVYQEVEIGILQPRKDHIDGPFRTWIVPPNVLNDFAKELELRAQATTIPNAPLVAGTHCRWCPAKAICGAMYNKTLAITQTDFKVIEKKPLPIANQLSVKDISTILEHEDTITSWFKSVRAYALTQLENGHEVPGFKLVKKRANRAWTSEQDVIDFIATLEEFDEENLFDSKIKSPAKMEKILDKSDKAILQQYITKPDIGNTIAVESDRRQEVAASIESDFEIITERSQ